MSPPQEQDPGIASLDPMPGRVIAGNFRIEKLIGAGAMGNVYKAEQLSLGKQVAIKVLHHHLVTDPTLVARFKREAKSASLLNHPNSIQIIDSGEDNDGTLYIAMELLTGRDLAQVIRDDFPLPLRRVGRIMQQVLSALDEAHVQGIVHRDLKPSNIMLIQRRGEQDFVKVCDFGIAKATLGDSEEDRAAMLTIQGLVCGTPEYMSPEQARAESLDGRADLYSAAVILFQLMTGDIPFRADSPMGIISRHLSEPPLPPSRRRPDLDIPRAVDDIVVRGMEKNRELRFPTAIAFRDAIDVMLNATIGPMTPLPPSVRAAMPTARDIAGPADPGRDGDRADAVARPDVRDDGGHDRALVAPAAVGRHRRRHNRAERVRLRRRGDGEAAPGTAGCQHRPPPSSSHRPRAAASGRPGERPRPRPDARWPAASARPRRRTSGRAGRGGRRALERPRPCPSPRPRCPRARRARPSPPPRRHHPRRLRRRQRRHAAHARCWPKVKSFSHRAK